MVSGMDQWSLPLGALKTLVTDSGTVVHDQLLCYPFQKNVFFCDCCRQKSLIMWHIFLKVAGTCKNCGNLQKLRYDEKEKKGDSPNTLFSLGYYLNVKSHFLLLPMISKHISSAQPTMDTYSSATEVSIVGWREQPTKKRREQ